MQEAQIYAEGDWIVHVNYGIGQIKGIDAKTISGEEMPYYRIEASDSTFWMPVGRMDSETLRPLSTPEEIREAIATLGNPPKKMSSNFKIRQNRIQRVRIHNTPRAIARLVRDLRAWKRKKGMFNQTERIAYRTLKQLLIEEWAIVIGMKAERAELELDLLLSKSNVPG